jgi:hypothetical protein
VREMILLTVCVGLGLGAASILLPPRVHRVHVTTTDTRPVEFKAPESKDNVSSRQRSRSGTSAKAASGIGESQQVRVSMEVLRVDGVFPEISSTARTMAAFPQARDIPSGMPRAEVEKNYGRPTLSTIQTRSGRLLQKYVYLSKDKSAATMAVLEDGRVVNSLNMPQ